MSSSAYYIASFLFKAWQLFCSQTWHTQRIVNVAPTAGEGERVCGMLSALVAAGIECRNG
jgi:hypothetical protein